MKRCFICCITLVFLITVPQAIDYHPKAGPWTLDFSSSENFSLETSSDEQPDFSLWLVILNEAAGGSSASFSLFSYNKSKSVDIYMNALFDAYIGIENITSPTKGPILIADAEGVQAEGFSAKSNDNWHGAAWPFKTYRDPDSKTNVTYDIIILQSNNLPADEFQEIAESLRLSKGYWFDLKPWVMEFNCSQMLIADKQIISGDYALDLYDQQYHRVAWIYFLSFPNLIQVNNQILDNALDVGIERYKVTSPTKKSIVFAGTQGRIAEGYSALHGRKWRRIAYPIGAEYDAFTGTNSTKTIATFDSLQDTDQFMEIVNSFRIINLAE